MGAGGSAASGRYKVSQEELGSNGTAKPTNGAARKKAQSVLDQEYAKLAAETFSSVEMLQFAEAVLAGSESLLAAVRAEFSIFLLRLLTGDPMVASTVRGKLLRVLNDGVLNDVKVEVPAGINKQSEIEPDSKDNLGSKRKLTVDFTRGTSDEVPNYSSDVSESWRPPEAETDGAFVVVEAVVQEGEPGSDDESETNMKKFATAPAGFGKASHEHSCGKSARRHSAQVRQLILSRRSTGDVFSYGTEPANFDHRKSRVEDAKASMQHHVFSWLDWSPDPRTPCYRTLHEAFPGALPGPAVHRRVSHYLQNHYAFTPENTLFGLSICPDEINNQKGGLANLMGEFWGEIFPLGGIGGAPFVGKTGFSAFSHHVPDDGNILILYGPHVAISQEGEVGKYLREGQHEASTACGAVIGAYQACCGLTEAFEETEIDDCDMQMAWLRAQLLPHTDRIREQADPLAELSYQAYEIVRTKIHKIVSTKFGKGYLVLLGGIQLNMPFPYADHFLPMSFEIMRADEATGGIQSCSDGHLMKAFKCELTQETTMRSKAENLEGS